MKKLLGLLSLVFIIWGFTIADDLSYISLDYCDTPEKILELQTEPGIETGICYRLSNMSRSEVTVKLSFVDGTFTNDQRQNKACLSDKDIENFGQYITDYDQFIKLKPGEKVEKYAKLLYPEWMDWLYYGCAVYSILEETQSEETWNFSILMRRAKFIDVIVGDPKNAQDAGIVFEKFTKEDWKNLSRNPKIRLYKDSSDGKYIIQLKVKNISKVQQDVVITWVAKNILLYKDTFVESRKILKWESLLISKKIEDIPLYNLKIKLNASNTPFTFGDQVAIVGHHKERVNIIVWNIITIVTLFGIILFIFIILFFIKNTKKRKEMEQKLLDYEMIIQKDKATKKAPIKKTIKKPIKKK